MIKKYKNLINEIHLNYINEVVLLLLLNAVLLIAMILTLIFFQSPLFIVLFILLLFISNFLIFNRYFTLKKKLYYTRLESLYRVLTLFRLDIVNKNNKNVALKRLTESDNLEFNECANKLLEAIKIDKSVEPFLSFSSFFKSNQANNAIINLYKILTNDGETKLDNFNSSYHLLENEVQQIYNKKTKRDYAFIRLSAFVGAIILLLIVVIAVILEIGNQIHG